MINSVYKGTLINSFETPSTGILIISSRKLRVNIKMIPANLVWFNEVCTLDGNQFKFSRIWMKFFSFSTSRSREISNFLDRNSCSIRLFLENWNFFRSFKRESFVFKVSSSKLTNFTFDKRFENEASNEGIVFLSLT